MDNSSKNAGNLIFEFTSPIATATEKRKFSLLEEKKIGKKKKTSWNWFTLSSNSTKSVSFTRKSQTFRDFHSVEISAIYSHTFWQKFRENNGFTR